MWIAEGEVRVLGRLRGQFVKGTAVSLERVSSTKGPRTHGACKRLCPAVAEEVAGEVLVASKLLGALCVGAGVGLCVGGWVGVHHYITGRCKGRVAREQYLR